MHPLAPGLGYTYMHQDLQSVLVRDLLLTPFDTRKFES